MHHYCGREVVPTDKPLTLTLYPQLPDAQKPDCCGRLLHRVGDVDLHAAGPHLLLAERHVGLVEHVVAVVLR